MAGLTGAPIRGKRMRVTALDTRGRPRYGTCAQVTSKGFVSVNYSPEVEEGEDLTQRTAGGELCVSERDRDTLKWWTLQVEFCDVDPALFLLMNPTWTAVHDAFGDLVGFSLGEEVGSDEGYALEVWTDTAGRVGQQWGYVLLPRIIAGAPDEFTIENGTVTFTLSGRTAKPNGWGRGPYDVVMGTGDIPTRLLAEVPETKHMHVQWTTVRPPEALPGCQLLARPVPDLAELFVSGVPGETPRQTVRLRVDNHGFGPVVVDWGDTPAAPTTVVQDGGTVAHTYTATGQVTITANDVQTPAVITTRQIELPLPPDQPGVTVAVDATDRQKIAVTVDNHGHGPTVIDWGDGSAPTSGPASGLIAYTYPVPGQYTISVSDAEEPEKVTRVVVKVPVPAAPLAAFGAGSGTTQGRITGNAANGAGLWIINWGDSSAEQVVTSLGAADQYNHTYANGTYTATIRRADNPLAVRSFNVTVPIA